MIGRVPARERPAPERRSLSPAALYEHAIRRDEAVIVSTGALTAETGQHTGRSPKDKFFVKEPTSQEAIWWVANQPIAPDKFDGLLQRVDEFCDSHEVFTQDVFACADPRYRLRVRVVSELAWHSLFARNLFIRPNADELLNFEPDLTVVSVPSVKADPKRDGTRSETFILVNLARRIVIIGGTEYAGEIKKSVFTALNYFLPAQGVFPMHCSANVSSGGSDVALFFGLSGTGKTTLSADPSRRLIGDDEHGWSDSGVFNFEGGCYAKTIRIHKESEPEIYAATEHFGTILENVVYDPRTRIPDYDSEKLTENTRAAYPVDLIPNAVLSGTGKHPSNVIFLSADAYGVLPPVARLDEKQIGHYFLSGYTAKVAGTERGVTEPEPIFSTCFAAPFLVLPPKRYADMLIERVNRHHAEVWMLNTGWVGGPYGVGQRMSIAHTRAIVRAVVQGKLHGMPTHVDPVFGLSIPDQVPDVPHEVLDPRTSWPDPEAYDRQAGKLRAMFEKNILTIGKSASTSG
ncbi:MAG TPA: phosphoenolpyruvate carboxykinase (ATP) [Gemmatimonadetes bacterium]|jgi:phosphoenolpyruvate carboxykinase (ATP)|nr:phosphoenolpyruvate carboxykinase (ATP) [Gemmatimonadota bacterium]